jgi:hypothetical protein
LIAYLGAGLLILVGYGLVFLVPPMSGFATAFLYALFCGFMIAGGLAWYIVIGKDKL